MRLTVEDHPEAIKRYDHIKPTGIWGGKSCSLLCPGTARTCTRAKGHRGPHVAHGSFRKVVAVWEADTHLGVPAQSKRGSPKAPARSGLRAKPIGLRSRSPVGFVEGLRALVKRVASSLEEIAFMIFFLAFVAFAIGGFLLIYLG